MILKVVKPLGEQAWTIASSNGQPREQIAQLVRLSYESFDSDWDAYYVALLLGDHLRAKLPETFPTSTQALTEVVRRGQDAGRVRGGDPTLLAVLCHGILLQVPRARAFGELQPPIGRYTDEVVEACWRVLAK